MVQKNMPKVFVGLSTIGIVLVSYIINSRRKDTSRYRTSDNNIVKSIRPIEVVRPEDVGFDDYGFKKTFHIDKSARKKVLITGAGSYIGESFEKYCGEHYPNIEIDTLDMRNNNWRKYDFSGYDSVFHVAGIAHADVGKTSPEEQERYYKVNTDLAIETAQKAKIEGVKQFVFMSSMIIYGDQEHITEDTIPRPSNLYGNSKWLADKGVREFVSDTFAVAVLRPPMIYGKGSKGNYPKLAKIAKSLPFFPKVGNRRSMLYIENLCEFVAQIVLSGGKGIFFPQNAEYSSTSEIVKTIAEVSGGKIIITELLVPIVNIAKNFPDKRIRKLARKAFGNSWYEMDMSRYKDMYEGYDYQMITLKESIKRTEG